MSHNHDTFESLTSRLAYLELWRELAVVPNENECHEDDHDLLLLRTEDGMDDLHQLSQRCLKVRQLMNEKLPQHELAMDNDLDVRTSTIVNAGLGLFFDPDHDRVIPEGSIICYYTGHRHNFFSQKYLTDRSYLLNITEDILVDSLPLLHVKARYVNDPLNEKFINCKFVPDHKDRFRCKLVAIRDIGRGEELFVSYGQYYWIQHKVQASVYFGNNK